MQQSTRAPGHQTDPRTVRCEPGQHTVPAHQAQQIASPDTVISGPGRGPWWACHEHIRSEGLVPLATYVGRRDGLPTPSRRPA